MTDAFHRARPAAAAVGLGRWRPNGPERLRSVRRESCDSRWLDPACCSRARSHPAPSRSPRAMCTPTGPRPLRWRCLPRQRRGWSPRAISPHAAVNRRAVASTKALGTGRERCVSPTSATDSLHEHQRIGRFPVAHSRDESVLRRVTSRVCLAHPGPKPSARRDAARLWAACRSAHRMNQPGEASLDGEPPASTIVATLASRPKSLPGVWGWNPHREPKSAARSWWSHDR
jgi:hypothetical protein